MPTSDCSLGEITYDDFALECEIVKAQAEADKVKAEAEIARWEAGSAKIRFEQDKINHEHQLNGVYTFHRGVTRKSMNRLFEAMHVWHANDPVAPWTIYLNSEGGDVMAGNGIVDEIASHSLRGGGTHHITIKVRGQASSMAACVLQAADHRIMGPYSLMMIHTGAMTFSGTVDELRDVSAWLDGLTEWMVRLFLSRTDVLSREEFLHKIERKDWWLSSDEALEMGFIDVIG